jgi:hypothetical protein
MRIFTKGLLRLGRAVTGQIQVTDDGGGTMRPSQASSRKPPTKNIKAAIQARGRPARSKDIMLRIKA